MKWVRCNYTCQLRGSAFVCDTPYITVQLSDREQSFQFSALIDSGCTRTQANAQIARMLDIDLATCEVVKVQGVGGICDGHLSSITLGVDGHGEALQSPIVFVENLPVAVLLGQDNFFDTFNIRFEKSNAAFYLQRAPKKRSKVK